MWPSSVFKGFLMQLLTVVNRSNRPLSATWDGRQYTVQPGKSSHPAIIARKLKYDNPIMGSDDPTTGQLQYLIGIEEEGDDVTPVNQSDEIELYNRKNIRGAIPVMVVQGNVGGLYSTPRSPQPIDSNFVKA